MFSTKFIGGKMKYISIAATVLALSAGTASAATFVFDESTVLGGDFDNGQSLSSTNVGTAMDGFSFVSGGLSGECLDDPVFGIDCNYQTTPGTDEQDSFQFTGLCLTWSGRHRHALFPCVCYPQSLALLILALEFWRYD